MLKRKNTTHRPLFHWLRTTPALLLLCSVVLASAALSPLARADQFDDQINALQQQNSGAQSNLNSLLSQASSYQDSINQLQAQINAVQSAIAANQAQQASLQDQITAAQAQLDQQKSVLANDVKALYVNGQITPIEMLATSNDLSDYIDKQQAYSAVQDKIQDTLQKITDLQKQLQSQKAQVDQLLTEQQQQNDQLTASQNQLNSLLSYNESQQAAYNSQIQSNQQQIASLRAAQAAANRRIGGSDSAGDPNHGGYPAKWDYPVGQDTLIDTWGMYNRECVSYTAWKVYQYYGNMPYWGGVGNANQWPGDARAAGIPTSSTPKVHSVAISMAGAYGHAMWVESINGDGTINVSQYNKNLNGLYSETYNINPSGLIFIYFGG